MKDKNIMQAQLNDKAVNKQCKQDFQKAIRDNFDGMYLNPDFIDEMISIYGLERLLYLCALTIASSEWDGRYSNSNKIWAKSIVHTEKNDELCLNTHPAVLDGVTNLLRKRQAIVG